MNFLKKEKIKKYIPLVVVGLMMYILLQRINLLPPSDDTESGRKVVEMGLFPWIKFRILNWQPRVFSDLFFGTLVQLPLFIWRILNSVVFSIMLLAINKIVSIKDDVIKKEQSQEDIDLSIFIACGFFFIPPYVITSGLLWFGGSLYYLWPAAIMMLTLLPLIYGIYGIKIENRILQVFFCITAVAGSYIEQSLAILICFFGLSIIFSRIKRIKLNKLIYIQYFLVLINAVIFLVLTKLGGRFDLEKRWYVGFDMLTMVDKVFQGINWTNYQFINSANVLMTCLVVIATILIWNRRKNIIIRAYALFVSIYWIVGILPLDIIFKNFNLNNSNVRFWLPKPNDETYQMETVLKNYLYDTAKVNPQNLLSFSTKNMLPSFVGLFMIILAILLVYLAFEDVRDKFTYTLLFLAMLASGYAISFSPTIYASGSRIFFIGDVILLTIASKMVSELHFRKIKYAGYWKYVIITTFSLIWFQFMFKFISPILWY